jgi:predicted molibdopterin-dependent oxidoreductase YjgC
MGGELGAASAEMLAKEIATVAPAYHGITWETLEWGAGREGLVLPVEEGVQHLEYIPVDGKLTAVNARYGLHLARVLYDDGVRTRMSPSLAALTPKAHVYLNGDDAQEVGVEPGAVVVVESEYGSAQLPVAIDNSLGSGTVYVPANLEATRGLGAAVAVVLTAGDDV